MLKSGIQGKFKGVVFNFTPKTRISFLNLCIALIIASLLKYFHPLLSIYIALDASGFAISTIFSQTYSKNRNWYFITFWYKKKSPAKGNYDMKESEMLAIVQTCKK